MARNVKRKSLFKASKVVRQTVIIVGIALLLFLCFTIIVLKHIDDTGVTNLKEVLESTVSYVTYKSVSVNGVSDEDFLSTIRDEYQKQIRSIACIINDSGYMSRNKEDTEEACSFVRKLANSADVEQLCVTDKDGKLVLGQHITELGQSIVDTTFLTPEQFSTLKSYANSPNDNYSGSMVVYSEGSSSEGSQYLIMISALPGTGGAQYYAISTTQYSTVSNILSKVQDRTLFSQIASDSTGLAEFMVVNLSNDKVVFSTSNNENDAEFVINHLDLFQNDKEWVDVQTNNGTYHCYVRVLGNELVIGFYNSKVFRQANMKSYASGLAISSLFLITEAIFILYVLHLDTMTEKREIRRGFVFGAALVAIGIFVLGTMFLESLRIVTSNSDTVIRSDTILTEASTSFEKFADELGDEISGVEDRTIQLVSEAVENVPMEPANPKVFYETLEDGTYHPVLDSFGNELVTYVGNEQLKQYADALDADNLWLVNDLGYAIASARNNWAFEINSLPEAESLQKLLRGQIADTDVMIFYGPGSDGNGESNRVLIASTVELYAYSDGSGQTRYLTKQQYEANQDNPDSGTNEVRQLTGLLVTEQSGDAFDVLATEYYMQRLYENMLDILKCAYVEISTEEGNGSRWETCTQNLGYDISFLTIPSEMTTEHYHYFPNLSGHETFTIACMDSANSLCGQYIMDYDTMMESRGDTVWYYFLVDVIAFFLLCVCSYVTRNKILFSPDEPEESELELSGQEFSIMRFRRAKYGPSAIPNALLMGIGLLVTLVALLNILGIFSSGGFTMVVQICSKEWVRELNLYNVGASIAIFGVTTMVMATIDDMVEYLIAPLGGGDLAVAKVIMALLRAATYIATALYGASLMGVKSATISAIITVGVGGISLGIRGLFEDLVNGIKLLISNRLYPGQKVKLGGNYYIVEKVGLDQIKLVNDKGEIKYLDAKDANQITYLDGW